jgi:hypothetical protein
MLKLQIGEQNKCGLDVSRFHTLLKARHIVVLVAYFSKMEFTSKFTHKVVPCVSERTKLGIVVDRKKEVLGFKRL